MNSYIFKLGHIPDLGQAEIAALLDASYSDIAISDGYAFASQPLRANDTGSVVWSGEVLFSVDSQLKIWTELKQHVLTQAGQIRSNGVKRLGLVLPKKSSQWKSEIIRELKSIGFKGVQLVFGEQNFSFGHYRKNKDWLLVLDTPQATRIIRLLDMSNQEFWSNLDLRLPQRDMKRGIINLKLARTLANLAKNTQLWDPFAGQGRVLAATLDRTTAWIASDIDQACLPELADNVGFAQGFWQRQGRRIWGATPRTLAEVENIYAVDVAQAADAPFSLKGYSLVTEGYLGPTLSKNATIDQAERHLSAIVELWTTTLQQLSQMGIQSVVACLPYYSVLPALRYQTVLKQFSQIEGVSVASLSATDFIVYSREKTRVGHLIFALNIS